jgi:hypothetical protein
VLPEHLSADDLYALQSEANVGRHSYGRVGIIVGPPASV